MLQLLEIEKKIFCGNKKGVIERRPKQNNSPYIAKQYYTCLFYYITAYKNKERIVKAITRKLGE